MMELLARLAGNLAALWVASELLDEMTYGGSFGVLLLAAVVFTLVNWIVKPVVAMLSISLIVVTLGVAYFFVLCRPLHRTNYSDCLTMRINRCRTRGNATRLGVAPPKHAASRLWRGGGRTPARLDGPAFTRARDC